MKLQLKGNIEIELPDGAFVTISEDGTKIKVADVPTAEPEVIEIIRIVEVAGPETIRYVPQYQWYNWPTWTQPIIQPDPQPVYPTYPPSYPIWVSPNTTITTTGTTIPVQSGTVTGGLGSLNGNTYSGGLTNSSFTLTNFQTGTFGQQTDDGDASCVSIN